MFIRTIVKCIPGLLSALVLSIAYAETENVMEEVVVMATKREQTLQEVAIAVSVIDAEVLEQAHITDMIQLQTLVPSLQVRQLQTTGNTNFVIRGFGNGANNPGIEPSVGVFIDGVYRSRSAAAIADLPNLERIEVLRGPQSTLFGKNASAGVINIVTAAPNMEEFGGSAELTLGNYKQVIAKADISGPVSDTVGLSLAVNGNKRDGWFDNLETGNDISERDRWGVRGQFLWLPSDNTTLRLIADYDDIDEKCCGVATWLPGSPVLRFSWSAENLFQKTHLPVKTIMTLIRPTRSQTKGCSLQADFNFSNELLLTSITAYRGDVPLRGCRC